MLPSLHRVALNYWIRLNFQFKPTHFHSAACNFQCWCREALWRELRRQRKCFIPPVGSFLALGLQSRPGPGALGLGPASALLHTCTRSRSSQMYLWCTLQHYIAFLHALKCTGLNFHRLQQEADQCSRLSGRRRRRRTSKVSLQTSVCPRTSPRMQADILNYTWHFLVLFEAALQRFI